METVTLLYEDYQKELAEDFKNTFLKRASDTDSSRSNDAVIDEVTDMLSTNIAVYTEKLLQRWGFSSGGEGGGGGDVTVTLDDLLKKYLSDNYVTIKGDQEVFGEKDFRKGIRIAGRRLYWDEGNDALVIEGAAYTTRWLSAKGVSPGGGGAGSGGGGGLISLVYGFESLGGTFDNNDNTATFNAFTINEIWKLASSGLTNVTVTGSGNAVTDVTKGSDGRSLTFTKGNTFASKSEFDALNTKFNDFLTGSDADDIINKWSELEVFLQGMKESDNLAVILQSKMDKSAFNKLFSALDSDGNEIDPSDDTKTVAAIRANFGFWGVDYVSAKGVSKGSGGTGGASALYQLVDVLANDTGDGVDGAVAGKALVFDGTHWKAADAGLNESQLSAFLSLNGYLTQTAADGRYVTSARKVIAGTGLSGGGSLTSDVTLSLGTSGVVAGTYTKVMVDVYGRVTSGTSLSATDIPSLDWSKITTGKPTTLAGYGITDAYSKTEADGKYVTIATAQTISGAKTFSAVTKTASVLPSADANSELGGTANRWNNIYSVNGTFSQNVTAKLLSASETLQIGDAYLKWDSTNNAVYVIKKDGTTPVGFYSTDWLSAKGVSMSGVQTGTLADLTDVEITNPTNGQALKYDATSQKWVNGTIDSFNVNQMWTELTKADSNKVIDASHIPTSVLDGRWVKKTGDTMTGTLTSASSSGSIVFKGLENCDITNIYTNNGTLYSDTNLAIRNGLRFNWYDTYWYIGNLRGAGTNSSGFGIANESNKLCLQVTPDYTTAPVFRSSASQGTAPFIVASNTVVGNLNADLLDGLHAERFLLSVGRSDGTFDLNTYSVSSIKEIRTTEQTTNNAPFAGYGLLANLWDSNKFAALQIGGTSTDVFFRGKHDGTNKITSAWHRLLHTENYASIADGRYVKKAGDTMTGDLAMDTNKGFYIPHGTRVVKTLGNWIHGGGDTASSTDANLRFGSWQGIGWYPTVGGQTVAQGENAMWLNVRYGNLNVAGGIKESTICIGRVNSSGEYDAAYNGEINRYDHHLFLQHHSGKYLIMCTGGGLAGIGTNSPGEKLHVAGNTRTDGYFRSTVGTGTQPYQCSSTTLNTNLNADLLDGYHQTAFTSIIGRRTLYTSGTAPYNYIYLFRIANSSGYSTLRVDIDIKTRYHRAILYVDIVSGQYAYGDNGTSVYISKFQVNGQSARLWYKITKQTSGYNYIDFYYQSGAWNPGSFDIVSRSSNGTLVFEPKSTNMDNLPSGCTEVGNTVFDGSITGNAATASRLQTARNINGTTFDGTANITTSYWGTTRTFYTNSHDSYRVSAGVNVNGSGNVTLLLPNSIRCSDWFRSTGNTGWYHENYGGGWYMTDANYIRNYNSKRLRIQTDTYDTIQLVRTSGSEGSSIAFYNGGGTFRGQFGMNATSWFTFDTGTATANINVVEISPAGGIHSKAEITAKASGSDIRLKKDIQNYNAMNIINKFRSVKYHWNDIAKANSEVYNNDYDQFGLIAQDLIAGGFEQWVRDVFHDYYTVTYERLIPVVWKGLQEVDDEVTKLKKEISRLNKKVEELEKSLCA